MVGPFFYIDSEELGYRGWLYHGRGEKRAEKYGDFLIDPTGHEELFDYKYKDAPDGIEYFNFPRGRVVYNTKTETHTIYLDKCIADKVDHVARAYRLENYTVNTDDEHYVCPGCMR